MATSFECTSKAIALSALDAIAASMKGAQRDAVLAVKVWIQENVRQETSPDEVMQRAWEILGKESEGERKGREWNERGTRKINGEWVSSEPEDGAEWKCVWNAKTKRWEPPYPLPIVEGRKNLPGTQ